MSHSEFSVLVGARFFLLPISLCFDSLPPSYYPHLLEYVILRIHLEQPKFLHILWLRAVVTAGKGIGLETWTSEDYRQPWVWRADFLKLLQKAGPILVCFLFPDLVSIANQCQPSLTNPVFQHQACYIAGSKHKFVPGWSVNRFASYGIRGYTTKHW